MVSVVVMGALALMATGTGLLVAANMSAVLGLALVATCGAGVLGMGGGVVGVLVWQKVRADEKKGGPTVPALGVVEDDNASALPNHEPRVINIAGFDEEEWLKNFTEAYQIK